MDRISYLEVRKELKVKIVSGTEGEKKQATWPGV